MIRSCAIAKSLDQSHATITLDQAIYCKALEIRWKHPEKFGHVVLRMGAFHIANTFIAVLGKRFADGGLRDLLVESGVVAICVSGCGPYLPSLQPFNQSTQIGLGSLVQT